MAASSSCLGPFSREAALLTQEVASVQAQRGLGLRLRVVSRLPASTAKSGAVGTQLVTWAWRTMGAASPGEDAKGPVECPPPEAGQYLAGLRSVIPGGKDSALYLPAIADVPSFDHQRQTIPGSVSCAVLEHPTSESAPADEELRQWPIGALLEIVLLARLADCTVTQSAGSLLEDALLTLCRVSSGALGSAAFPSNSEFANEETPIQTEAFDFNYGGVRVQVRQRRWSTQPYQDMDMTGHLVWPTATIFCRSVVDGALQVRGQRVLDLGAGTGIVGLVAASCGASVTLTDIHRVMPLLTRNVASFAVPAAPSTWPPGELQQPDVAAAELYWGDTTAAARLVSERGPFDLILCCEVVYQQVPAVLLMLQTTLRVLLRPGSKVVFVYQQRDGAEVTDAQFFESLPSACGLRLEKEETLSQWDESWDDICLRCVRTYVAE